MGEDNLSMIDKLKLYLDLIRWNRPAGWLLLLWPSLAALWVAAEGFPGWHLVMVFTLGTILMRSAGCCINDVADRDFDKHVKRTANRPVTSGRLSTPEALMVGAVLALCAFGLVLTTNLATIAWSFAALAVTLAYPYAKRFVAMPQAVLGVAFSFGIPMAFAAVQGEVPPLAWGLLLGNLFWVLAYDTEYAMVDRDDDLKIGMKTSAITLGQWDVLAIMGFYPIFSGITQELLFRGFFMERYKVLFANPWVLIIVNGILFGAAHLMFGHWLTVGLSTLGGFIYAWLYHRYKSILIASIVHGLIGNWI